MSFLEGLAAFGGGFAEEATAYKTAQSNQLLKQQQLQLREAQLALLMQKTGQAQQAQQTSPMTAALEGAAGTPSDPSTDPTALQYAPPAPAGGPQGGANGQAPTPPGTAQAPPSGALGGINQALQRGGQATPPTTQVSPPGQTAGAAGAGMPAPPPIGGSTLGPGDPLAQAGPQLQAAGQARMQAGTQPQVPPGPGGAPSFAQPQGATLPAKPVKTISYGRGQDPGAAATQAPPPIDPTDPRRIPKGLKNLATPEQQAQAGITQPQPQQKGTQVAQAGEPGTWKPGQRPTLSTGMSWLRQKFPGKSEADYAKAYKEALPAMRATARDEALQEQRAATRQHMKTEEALQAEAEARRVRTEETKKEEKEQRKKDVDSFVTGIEKRLLPPSVIGTRADRVPIEAEVARRGINLPELQNQWLAAQMQIKSMNSQRMSQTFGYARSVQGTLKRTLDAAKKLDLGGFKDYNKLKLEAEARTQGNSETGQLIRKYITDINTLKAEFAQLENAGYAPTESVWKLANEQIDQNWGFGALRASLEEVSALVDIRVNAFHHMGGGMTPDMPNPYMPSRQQDQPQTRQQQQQPAAPQPGEIRKFKDGGTRRLKGGDPDDPNNWEPVT